MAKSEIENSLNVEDLIKKFWGTSNSAYILEFAAYLDNNFIDKHILARIFEVSEIIEKCLNNENKIDKDQLKELYDFSPRKHYNADNLIIEIWKLTHDREDQNHIDRHKHIHTKYINYFDKFNNPVTDLGIEVDKDTQKQIREFLANDMNGNANQLKHAVLSEKIILKTLIAFTMLFGVEFSDVRSQTKKILECITEIQDSGRTIDVIEANQDAIKEAGAALDLTTEAE